MNREIKFRAWDGIKFHYFNVLSGLYGVLNPDIQQYTGLKDKNGVEIYEGDIIKCGYGVGKVIFNAGCFMVCWIDDKEAYMEFVFSRKGMYRRKDDEEFEVIGNIYDNPELLK